MNYQPKRANNLTGSIQTIFKWLSKIKLWKLAVIIVSVGAIIAVGFAARDEAKKRLLGGPSQSIPAKSNVPADYLIKKVGYKKCKEEILTQIISPATAKFPDNFTYRIDAANQIVHVQGYVDCQNMYGAMLRTNWTGKIGYNASSPDDYQSWAIKIVITK